MGPLKVFISYRRADTQHVAGRLGDRIASRFTLFMDIDDIPLGVDFTKALNEAVSSSDVVVVLIGQRFFGPPVVEPQIGSPRDWVVAEVSAALDRGLVVIPVLVDDADMPEEAQLPEPLWPLRQRQALRLSHASFNTDVEKLVDALTMLENRKRVSRPAPADPPTPSRDALFRDPDYSRAVAAAYRRQWAEAVELFTLVQQRFPTDERVRTPLADAKASDAEARGQWYEAVTALEALVAVRPGDQAIQNRLAGARREVEIGDLIGQLRALAAAEEWAGVVAMSQRIGELDPTRADPDGLAGTARAQLQARDLDNRYSFGLAELDRGHHRQAYEVFVAISRERPGYREVNDLLRLTQERSSQHPASPPVAAAAVVPPPVAAVAVHATRRRPLADTSWIWLVLGGSVFVLLLIQGLVGARALPVALFLAVVSLAVLTALMLRDSNRLDRSDMRALHLWSVVGLVGGTTLIFLASRMMGEVFRLAHKYSIYADHASEAPKLLGLLVGPVPVAAVAGWLLGRKMGRVAVWPALIFCGCSAAVTLILVGLWDI